MATQELEQRFVIEARLDQGRVGPVYAAVDTRQPVDSPRRRVALRLLPAELARNKAAAELFRRDFERVRDFTHPSVPQLFELGHEDDTYFVTSELLDGETLRNVLDHLRPERLDSLEADEIITALGDVLVRAHDHGIVHGDVRPENVLVTTGHEIKLLNLASATVMRSAPISVGPAEDVRALAMMAYELYTGEPAPRERSMRSLRRLPKRRRRAIRRVLLESAGRSATDLRGFLADAGLPVVGWVPYSPAASRPPAIEPRRRPALRTAAVVAVLSAGAAAVLGGLSEPLGDIARRIASSAPGPARGEASADRSASALDGAPAAESFAAGALSALGSQAGSEPQPEERDTRDGRPPSDVDRSARDGLAGRAPAESALDRTDASALVAGRAPASGAPVGVYFPAATLMAYEGRTPLEVEVRRDGDTSARLEFTWWTRDGTARDGDDYARFDKRADAFAPGESIRTLRIPIASDNLPENSENFFIELDPDPDDPATGSIETATVVLIDDDR